MVNRKLVLDAEQGSADFFSLPGLNEQQKFEIEHRLKNQQNKDGPKALRPSSYTNQA